MPPQSPSKPSTAWLKDRERGPRPGETSHSHNHGREESSQRSVIPPVQYGGGFYHGNGPPPVPATPHHEYYSLPNPGYSIPPPTVTSSSVGNEYQRQQHLVHSQQPYSLEGSNTGPAGLGFHDRLHQPYFPPHGPYQHGPAEAQYRPHQPYQPPYHAAFPRQEENKRRRRRPEEIDRIYICGWEGCQKGYGTLNHLNAHVTMQSHGIKRKPERTYIPTPFPFYRLF
ncbi:uncharacterized protein PG998_005633 [Apiospora kogelbergensis]|uniref:uncharacterized protein n=1 Tax=Apiospora kogelbergensis TaxID=1337665 RepID=UPI0031303267